MGVVARTVAAKDITKPTAILLVAPPARGGIAHHVTCLLAGLHREGYRVGVACHPEGPIAEAAADRELPTYPVDVAKALSPAAALGIAFRLSRAAADLDAAIIHTHAFRAGFVGALARPLARKTRLVATIHNFPPGSTTMRPRSATQRWGMNLLTQRAVRLISVSHSLQQEMLALRPDVAFKACVIPNGVDTNYFEHAERGECRASLGLPAERPLVGMLARLAPAKGVPEFLHACRLAADRWPEALFVIAGDGPLREEVDSLSRRLDLADRLLSLGAVASTRDFLGALDVLVVPSTSEGSSVTAMEAMSAGKPVVATAVGGGPEVVADGETGILVRPSDPEALAGAIDQLLASPQLRRQMGERGCQRASQLFDVRLMLERTKQVYSDVVREMMHTKGDVL